MVLKVSAETEQENHLFYKRNPSILTFILV